MEVLFFFGGGQFEQFFTIYWNVKYKHQGYFVISLHYTDLTRDGDNRPISEMVQLLLAWRATMHGVHLLSVLSRLVKHIKSESQWCEKERECRESRLATGQISTHDGAHRHSQAFWFADPLAQSAFHFLELVPDDENSCLVGETVKDIIIKARIWFTHYTNNLKIHLEVKSIFYRPPATI